MGDRSRDYLTQIFHQLRNRLIVISGYASELTGSTDSYSKKAGERILLESTALTEGIEQLITLSRVNSEALTIVFEAVPVIDLIENCMDRYDASGASRGISVELDDDAPDIYVLGTEDLLEDILDNLLSNAIRYCKEKIRISVQSEDEIVTVQVADDGPGIREEDLPHLFELFYKGKDGNFGLGLPIARSAAEKMGGTLTAANGPEGGAVFTLKLPQCIRDGDLSES